MLPNFDTFNVYATIALFSLVLVVILMCFVVRFPFPGHYWISTPLRAMADDDSKPSSIARNSLPRIDFPSITTIASFPNLPQIVVEDPPDYEAARASPCPSYEDVVTFDAHCLAVSRSSMNLLAVIP